jgi:hypothetical protein
VAVQLTADGLNATLVTTVKMMGALVPPEVSTNRVSGPTGTPTGTVVTIRRFVQSAALAMAAVSRPPAVVENTTWPDATLWLVPKLLPSMTTVAPIVPEGNVAPFTTVIAGAPAGPVGPLLPPHAASRTAADTRMTIRTRIGGLLSEVETGARPM